jgi:hypothetical protein
MRRILLSHARDGIVAVYFVVDRFAAQFGYQVAPIS